MQMKQDGKSSQPQAGSTTQVGQSKDAIIRSMIRVGDRPTKKLWLVLADLDHLSPQELDAWEAESGMLQAEWDSLPEA